MKNIVLGVVAHVDAGKTTLCEGILYKTGVIKRAGRVDKKDTLLDNLDIERQRGITVFSKQAVFSHKDTYFTLMDTPGHVDFSVEMERSLKILDYAVLIISASEGIQSHTKTLWKLLKAYNIPTFIFVNKMDMPDIDKQKLKSEIIESLSDNCIEVFDGFLEDSLILENISLCDDDIFNSYMNEGSINEADIRRLVLDRKLFPVFFGCALKLQGIDFFLDFISKYTLQDNSCDSFGARVYKITRDENNQKLTHLRIDSGKLMVKQLIEYGSTELKSEKIDQIRIYNGTKYEAVSEVFAGQICAVTGLSNSYANMALGVSYENTNSYIEPVLSYRIILPEGHSDRLFYQSIKKLDEEIPELDIVWDERHETTYIKVMGPIQLEILKTIIAERFNVQIEFGESKIAYKETVADTVIGVGHFEPLRHYAEVHLRIEPKEKGSGISIETDVSEDILAKNWQRLIYTHLNERVFTGVLTNSPLTDIKLTLINGKAHQKHTEGGDFRQATHRAVRQGLMQADNLLLEPYYNFTLSVPQQMIGKAMTDIDAMYGKAEPISIDGDMAVITGSCPVSTMRDYQINLNAYTKGLGSISTVFGGYMPCHNSDEIIKEIGYDPESDTKNPSSSVFCAHGSGFIVPWDQVYGYMHVFDEEEKSLSMQQNEDYIRSTESFDYSIGTDEIDEIMQRTFLANKKRERYGYQKKKPIISKYTTNYKGKENTHLEKLLIVDGYNVIFAWEDLKELSKQNIDSARDSLINTLSVYQSVINHNIILVFDGYKNIGSKGSENIVENVKIVYTREGETADNYIEKYTNQNSGKYDITVATSDNLIQTITRGQSCKVISSKELKNTISTCIDSFRNENNLS